ncbi:MAG: hypothetical protein LBU53_12415 [Zoogloeaceae bacterium]|nr:hypothetical protein [Zoogloeaceae bacterium]
MNNIHKGMNMLTLIKRGILFLSLFLLAIVAQADDVLKFSERYYAKITEDETIQVYERKRPKKPIITVEQIGISVVRHTSNPLIYKDFNFDGKNDLAIVDSQYICHGGSSYQVYLANNKGGFTHNPEFTRLAQEYCGFFNADAKTKTIKVHVEIGWQCWLFETYDVVGGNKLRRIYSLTEDEGFSLNFSEYTIIKGSGKNAKKTIRYTLNKTQAILPPLFQFRLQSAPHKKVALLHDRRAVENFQYATYVDYALLNGKDDRVEYSYELAAKGKLPPSKMYRDHTLTFDAENNSVCFGIGDTNYTVIDQPKRLGVRVKQGKRVTFLAGDPETRIGDLANIHAADNVTPGSCPLK